MKRVLACLLLLCAPCAAQDKPAQPPAASEPWSISGEEARLTAAGVVFPRRAGTTAIYRSLEFSRQGEGLDNGLQYRSDDEQVFATAYVYAPGLAHSGLSAFATDSGLRDSASSPLSGGEPRIVAAGGVEGAAIRHDYGRYRGNLASSAAFIKVGRWIVKLRVSGPEARRAEVLAAMDALLAGMRFDPARPPHPAAPIAIRGCPRGLGGQPARLLPDPPTPEVLERATIATLDGGGQAGRSEQGTQRALPSRVPDELCLSRRGRGGSVPVPILRAEGGPMQIDGRTMLIAPFSDAGGMFEVVEARSGGRFWLMRHAIGETILLGSYDGVPSDDQILALFSGQSDETRIRARVRLKADGNQEIILNSGAAPRPPAPTT